MKKIYSALIGILVILFGILLSIYAEYDDSPGGVIIGGIIASIPIIMYFKLKQRVKIQEGNLYKT